MLACSPADLNPEVIIDEISCSTFAVLISSLSILAQLARKRHLILPAIETPAPKAAAAANGSPMRTKTDDAVPAPTEVPTLSPALSAMKATPSDAPSWDSPDVAAVPAPADSVTHFPCSYSHLAAAALTVINSTAMLPVSRQSSS